jgi:PAS domain S-box-containing protein
MATAQQQLRLYQLLVEHSLGLMCIHNLDGVLLAINPAACASLGFSVDEGIGRNLREFLAPSVRPLFDRYLERMRLNRTDGGLMRLVAKNGSQRIWMYRNVTYDDAPEPQVLGHALDITDRVALEQQLKQVQRELVRARNELAVRVEERTIELKRANRELRTEIEQRMQVEDELLRARKLESLAVLAGGIAHDFNNFLTVVQGNAELAQAYVGSDDPVSEMLAEIKRACARATQLASKLLTFGKGGTPVRRPCRIGELLRESVDLALAGSNVRADFEIPTDLWLAEVDSSQIVQALHNIVLNARQSMPHGGVIQVRAENVGGPDRSAVLEAGAYVRLYVRDCGCGIRQEDLPRIFDPYFTTKQSGHGLGLATAHSIVMKHQGNIAAHSEVGKGTTFIIDLPASEDGVDDQPVRSHVDALASGRLLVMDDEEPIRKVLARALERFGYDVEEAADGAEAVAKYKAALVDGIRFAAVMLDMTVPGGVGGADAAVELRRIDPAVRMILSSGYAEDSQIADYRQHGFDAVLPKPWTPLQVREVVARVLNS